MPERHHKQRKTSPGTPYLLLSLILWLAFTLRALSLVSQGAWRDEVDQWRFAMQPLAEMVQNFTRVGWNGPLYSPLLRVWITLTGDSIYAMRYFSLLWGVVCVSLVYVLGRRLLQRPSGVWAALILALSPYMVWYSQEIKMYTWMPMLVLLALYALLRACAQPRWSWWLTLLFAATFAFYSHILAALLIPVLFLWLCLCARKKPQVWTRGLIVFALLTLPYLPLFLWQVPILLAERETGYPASNLVHMGLTLLSGWWGGIASGRSLPAGVSIYSIAVGCVLALLGTFWMITRARWRALLMFLSWLLIPWLALWLVSLRGPIFTDRYLIWLAPALYLLAGAGIAALQEGWQIHKLRRFWIFAPLLCALFFVGLLGAAFEQALSPIKVQFDKASDYMLTHRHPEELLLFQIPYNHFVAEYYFEQRDGALLDPWAEAPYTNWRNAQGDYERGVGYVDTEMLNILGSHDTVMLVYSEALLWDDRELVKAWLDSHASLIDTQDFVGVSLYRYQWTPPELEP